MTFFWLLTGVCWGMAFVLACRLTSAVPADGDAGGVAGKVMGGGRRAVSASMYETAEVYFHKGVRSVQKRAITNDWFQRSLGEISPQGHRHTGGRDNAEILPWLQMATRADPHNVDAFLVMSFWLATGLNRPELAAQVLAEAQRHNPGDYRIPKEQGRLAIHEGRFAEGRRKLEAAVVRWPSGLPEDRQALLDKAELHLLLGLLCEEAGERERAIGHYKNALAIFPERAYIKERVAALQGGREPEPAARESLQLLVKQTTEHVCQHEAEEREDHDDHGDDAHGHHGHESE